VFTHTNTSIAARPIRRKHHSATPRPRRREPGCSSFHTKRTCISGSLICDSPLQSQPQKCNCFASGHSASCCPP
jgi:hypothetical protein